jgi:hypothetical protein
VAYPLAPMPTLGEFITQATGTFGATLHEIRGTLTGPHGPVPVRYLVRGAGSFAILPAIADHERLVPDVLRSLCEQLAIPPESFGLTLTE